MRIYEVFKEVNFMLQIFIFIYAIFLIIKAIKRYTKKNS
jgi:hypothetical protein